MNKRLIIAVLAISATVALAGCEDQGDTGDNVAKDVGENLSVDWPGGSYAYEVRKTEENQLRLIQKHPPIQMDSSLERENLIRRYEYLNDRNNVHHVYLISENGQIIRYFIAQGKVSSVNSKLTNDVQIIRIPNCDPRNGGNDCWKKVESPQMDGSYGTNGAAIFFFTASGNYVEWNGLYLVSEQPQSMNDEPLLVEQANETN